jgi:adenylylsulfate reductase subunit A
MSTDISKRTKIVDSDVLVIGGGMAGCGAAYEARYWGRNLKIVLVEKAVIERSGAVAMGLSAINTYMGMKFNEKRPEDFVKYCRNDLMGLVREDLAYDIARHVDSTVHLLEEWGLPIWKDQHSGKYFREGPWQVMIHGESYKPIVAEAARKSVTELYEKIAVTHLLTDSHHPNRIAGAIGFSTANGDFFVFRAKAVVVAAGGATRIFRTRSTAEGHGRSWYPPWNCGTSYALMIQAGAELTCMENRIVVTRFKDSYGPVGMWFLLLKARATNSLGEEYERKYVEEQRALYGNNVDSNPFPTCLRNDAMFRELKAGRGPIYLHTEEVLSKNEPLKNIQGLEVPGSPKDREAEAWEYFLNMTISQGVLWAASNKDPTKEPSELMAAEPYIMGSHATMCGAWASGPADMAPKEYQWGYNRMTTVEGLFAAGDGIGAEPHKFSSGAHVEGRLAAKSAVQYVMDRQGEVLSLDMQYVERLKEEVFRPLSIYKRGKAGSTRDYISPAYLLPEHGLFRLEKLMDDYVGGWGTSYTTNEKLLNEGMRQLTLLKEDLSALAAENLHYLMRVWELHHRVWTAEAVIRHTLFIKETRWPGYVYRSDYPTLDNQNWRCFVNSRFDPITGEWSVFTRPYIQIVSE